MNNRPTSAQGIQTVISDKKEEENSLLVTGMAERGTKRKLYWAKNPDVRKVAKFAAMMLGRTDPPVDKEGQFALIKEAFKLVEGFEILDQEENSPSVSGINSPPSPTVDPNQIMTLDEYEKALERMENNRLEALKKLKERNLINNNNNNNSHKKNNIPPRAYPKFVKASEVQNNNLTNCLLQPGRQTTGRVGRPPSANSQGAPRVSFAQDAGSLTSATASSHTSTSPSTASPSHANSAAVPSVPPANQPMGAQPVNVPQRSEPVAPGLSRQDEVQLSQTQGEGKRLQSAKGIFEEDDIIDMRGIEEDEIIDLVNSSKLKEGEDIIIPEGVIISVRRGEVCIKVNKKSDFKKRVVLSPAKIMANSSHRSTGT